MAVSPDQLTVRILMSDGAPVCVEGRGRRLGEALAECRPRRPCRFLPSSSPQWQGWATHGPGATSPHAQAMASSTALRALFSVRAAMPFTRTRHEVGATPRPAKTITTTAGVTAWAGAGSANGQIKKNQKKTAIDRLKC